jgi:hypothetical protein
LPCWCVCAQLFLTSLLTFLPAEWQMPAGLIACALYMTLALILDPFVRTVDQRMALAVQSCLYCLLLCGMVLQREGFLAPESLEDYGLSVVLLVLCAAIVVLFVYHCVLHFRALWRDMQRRKLKNDAVEMASTHSHSRNNSTPPAPASPLALAVEASPKGSGDAANGEPFTIPSSPASDAPPE